MEAANFAGFSHAGIPVIIRGSMKSPTIASINTGTIRIPVAVKGLFVSQRVFIGRPQSNFGRYRFRNWARLWHMTKQTVEYESRPTPENGIIGHWLVAGRAHNPRRRLHRIWHD